MTTGEILAAKLEALEASEPRLGVQLAVTVEYLCAEIDALKGRLAALGVVYPWLNDDPGPSLSALLSAEEGPADE